MTAGKGDELPTALVASRSCPSCLPRRIRAGLSHHIGAVRDCGGVRDRRRDGARDIDAGALTNGGQNLTDGRKKCAENVIA